MIVVTHSFVEVIISKSLGKTAQLQCTVLLGKHTGALVGSSLTWDATQERQKLRGRKSIKVSHAIEKAGAGSFC